MPCALTHISCVCVMTVYIYTCRCMSTYPNMILHLKMHRNGLICYVTSYNAYLHLTLSHRHISCQLPQSLQLSGSNLPYNTSQCIHPLNEVHLALLQFRLCHKRRKWCVSLGTFSLPTPRLIRGQNKLARLSANGDASVHGAAGGRGTNAITSEGNLTISR